MIGVPRAGTTWLHEVLAAHPDVGVPQHRKELHYFDRNFSRGCDWYASYFEGLGDRSRRGEVTPSYLYVEDLARRIETVPTIRQLIVVLRDPVERLISHYRWRVRQDGFQGGLADFVEVYPEAIDWGDYLRHLERLSAWVRSERLLVLSYEALHDPDSAELDRLAAFLGISAGPFRRASRQRVNVSRPPRSRWLWKGGVRLARWLRDHRMDRLVNALKPSAGLLLESGKAVEKPVNDALTDQLASHYRSRLAGLGEFVSRDLTGRWPWFDAPSAERTGSQRESA